MGKYAIKFDQKEDRTKQSFRPECDINSIMAKYYKNGRLPEMIKRNPVYGDFSTAVDFQTAQNLVIRAEEQFNGLSAKVRDRFKNDPAEFLKFATDPKNQEELVAMGLAKEKTKEQVVVSKPAEPEPAKAPEQKNEEDKK